MQEIIFENTKNIKEIANDKMKPLRLIRNGTICEATNEELLRLKNEFNVKIAIDLRADFKIAKKKNDYFNVVNIPITDQFVAGVTDTKKSKLGLYLHYIFHKSERPTIESAMSNILSKSTKPAWIKIFEILRTNTDGAVLFFCSQGKDRTGILAMLIEYILGFSRDDMLEDYLFSNKDLEKFSSPIWRKIEKFPMTKKDERISQTIQVCNRRKFLFY